MKWIFITNSKYFNFEAAIRDDEVGFKDNNYKIEPGDIVYIYEAGKEKWIRFKCVVTSANNERTVTDERKYGGWGKDEPIFNFTVSLDYEFSSPITFSQLVEHGISPKRISVTKSSRKPEVFEFLEECEALDRIRNEPQEAEEETSVIGGERTATVKQRINQTYFRDRLIKKYGKCAVCGNDEIRLLNASHIIPWRDCDDNAKIELNNGLLLCPAHDRCFDLGYISFDENGKIMVSSKLSKDNKALLNIKSSQKIELTEDMKPYMDYHRKNIFQK
ncbi:MAG: HNH endonuclease [Solobacterium sp.]|nr:HNH endonuclease [Solobacterium sp.]